MARDHRRRRAVVRRIVVRRASSRPSTAHCLAFMLPKHERNLASLRSPGWTWHSCAGRGRPTPGLAWLVRAGPVSSWSRRAPRRPSSRTSSRTGSAGQHPKRTCAPGSRRSRSAPPSPGGRSGPPTLDDDGVVRHAGAWVSLPPVEARLTRLLLDRYGAVVSREALAKAGWPDGAARTQRSRRACAAPPTAPRGGRARDPHRPVPRLPAGGPPARGRPRLATPNGSTIPTRPNRPDPALSQGG